VGAHAQDYELLRLDMPNLLAGAGVAEARNLVQTLSLLVVGGYPMPAFTSYFNARGHTLPLLERLDQAIAAARALGEEARPTLHFLLGKRGDAHFDRGEHPQAEACFKESLGIEINAERTAKLAGLTGKALAFQGRRAEASPYFRRAYWIARGEKDLDLCCFVLEQQSHAAAENQRYSYARQLANYGVKLIESQINDQNREQLLFPYFLALLNLGSAELELARQKDGSFEAPLATHQSARKVADELNDEWSQAHICAALGEDYHRLEKREEAQMFLHRAIHNFHTLGQTRDKAKYIRFLAENGYPSVEFE
jgi:tetratricopeptide (TPR) repeat protein